MRQDMREIKRDEIQQNKLGEKIRGEKIKMMRHTETEKGKNT